MTIKTADEFKAETLGAKKNYIRAINGLKVNDAKMKGMNEAQLDDEYEKYLNDVTYVPEFLTGRGLITEKKSKRRKVRLISGKGAVTEIEENTTTNREHKNGKYIEMDKLTKDNVLSVKYASTNTFKKKPIYVSNDTKTVILNIIEEKFNETLYKNLNQNEKPEVDKFVKLLKYDVNANEGINERQRKYSILIGEIQAGNDNPLIRKKLKQYIMMALSEGLIKKSEAMDTLMLLNV